MASEKQVLANRKNSLKSTGPKTAEGKAKVSMNALKHGLTSVYVLIPGEDAEELEAFREAMLEGLAPGGTVELWWADRIVACWWRLRRVAWMEGELVAARVEEWGNLFRLRGDEEIVPGVEREELTPARLAAKLLQCTDVYDKLGRYESRTERALYRAYHELERLQTERRGREVPPPVVVDVQMSGALEGADR